MVKEGQQPRWRIPDKNPAGKQGQRGYHKSWARLVKRGSTM